MKLLLLGRTPEAIQIGRATARMRNLSAIASVARGARPPEVMILPMRIGGWGDARGFSDWL